MNETTRTIPRLRLVAHIAAVLCLLGAVALLPAMAFAAPVTTSAPAVIPASAANFQIVTLTATDSASPGVAPVITYSLDGAPWVTYNAVGPAFAVPIMSTFGSHTLSYLSTDLNGVEATHSASVSITDTTTPLTSLSTGWGGPIFDGSASFGLTATDTWFVPAAAGQGFGVIAVGSGVPAGNTWYSLNGATFQAGTTVSSSVLGTNTLVYYSTDASTNRESNEATVTFWVRDNVAPVTSDNATSTYAGSAAISLTATDNAGGAGYARSGVAHTYYQLDGTGGDPWLTGTSIVTNVAGAHTLTYYSVDNSGNNEAFHRVDFTVTAADVTAPVTTLTGATEGQVFPAGSTAHIVLTAVDGGAGVAALHYTVDGVAKNGVRAAAIVVPQLAVPAGHPGGTAAQINTSHASCFGSTCHTSDSWVPLPTGPYTDHTGLTSANGCANPGVCHTVVNAPPITEPADHATHPAFLACTDCHGAYMNGILITGPIMPTGDNPGDVAPAGAISGHFLGAEPDADGNCADCHTYTIASGGGTPPASTASTITIPFDVSTAGAHTITYWAVDKASPANTESLHTLHFSITATSTQPPAHSISTTLTIGASPTSVKLPKPFILSGLVLGGPDMNLRVQVMVKRPGRSYFSYSSVRGTYNVTATDSSWWYRYTPTLRGTYQFFAVFTPLVDSPYMTSTSRTISVTVK